MPTSSEPTRPGPSVTAMADRSSKPVWACSNARRTTDTMARRCSREASSGTTPPYLPWVASCDAMTEERMLALSSTTAAAVSSQEVSIPRMRIVSWGLDLAQFNYHLPESSIAQEPLEDRAASRMLVLHRSQGRWEDRMFREFPQFMGAGDCLVLNDSKVLPSRLLGRRAGKFSGQVEILLLQPLSEDAKTWTALVHPGRKMRTGERVRFDNIEAEIIGRGEYGERTVRFHLDGDIYEVFQRIGHVALAPYI